MPIWSFALPVTWLNTFIKGPLWYCSLLPGCSGTQLLIFTFLFFRKNWASSTTILLGLWKLRDFSLTTVPVSFFQLIFNKLSSTVVVSRLTYWLTLNRNAPKPFCWNPKSLDRNLDVLKWFLTFFKLLAPLFPTGWHAALLQQSKGSHCMREPWQVQGRC